MRAGEAKQREIMSLARAYYSSNYGVFIMGKFRARISLGNRTARTHARTETEIDFPVGLTPQPSITHDIISTYTLYVIIQDIV